MDFKTFQELSTDDLNLYYSLTFLPLKVKEDTKKWYHIAGFGAASSHVAILPRVFIIGDDGKKVDYSISSLGWDFDFPLAGNYNFRNSVIIFTRNPARTTHKAISQNTAFFHNLMAPFKRLKQIPAEFYDTHSFNLCTQHLNELFDEVPHNSFITGLEKIMKKQAMARMINDRISISQGIISKLPCIWLKTRLIGQLDVEKARAIPLHDLFVPELQSTFGPLGFSV